MSEKKNFLNGITAKLSLLMGGALAVAQASAMPTTSPQSGPNPYTLPSATQRKPLPAKLLLKQQRSGFVKDLLFFSAGSVFQSSSVPFGSRRSKNPRTVREFCLFAAQS